MPKRNDPCPCGSGKKYKHCCLLKEMQERAERRPETPAPEASPEIVPSTVPAVELDPLTERMNEWWKAFKAASYEEQWKLVDRALQEEPELMDGEMIFEVGNTLFGEAKELSELERFGRLLDSLKEVVPEAYEEELAYVLEWRFESALVREDWPAVKDVFLEFSERTAEELDIYYRLIHALAYRGRLDILLEGIRRAFRPVEEATGLVPWASGEFAELLGTYEIMQRLEENPQATAGDPELRQRFAEYQLTVVPEELDKILAHRSGRGRQEWSPADFVLSPPDESDEDPAAENLFYLLLAWTYYSHSQEGVPLTKVELAREPLFRYFVKRSAGELNGGREWGYGRKRRGKRRPTAGPGKKALLPDRRTFDRFLGEMVGFLSFRHYEASALFELIPVWLRFLKRRGLADQTSEKAALQDLEALQKDMVQIAEKTVTDPKVAENLRAWPGIEQ